MVKAKVVKTKGTSVLGHVVRNNVPMFVSFDDKDVEFVANSVAQAIDMAYKVYHMFQNKEDDNDISGNS